jgi:hypothetical protein
MIVGKGHNTPCGLPTEPVNGQKKAWVSKVRSDFMVRPAEDESAACDPVRKGRQHEIGEGEGLGRFAGRMEQRLSSNSTKGHGAAGSCYAKFDPLVS